jgi:cell division protein FtsL
LRYKPTTNAFKTVTQLLADALTGRMGVMLMVLSYSALAVVLLAYVSTQVYTCSLMEDVAERKRQQRDMKENLGVLTARYTSLSSRTRISQICKEKLDMVDADALLTERISIESSRGDFTPRLEFTDKAAEIREVLGSNIDGITEAMKQ